MKKKNTTKKALVSSLLALTLSSSMLVGTTFAWFTDSVTSTGNKIVAGTLKVDLELLDKNGSWNSIKESKAPIFNYDNWEPGYTDVKVLKVENEGTLALKWKAKFVSDEELSALANVIDVYVNPSETALAYPTDFAEVESSYTHVGTVADFVNTIGETTYGTLKADGETGDEAYLGIALKMQESAGNEYQNMSLGDFDIQIVATQLAYEEDSFGPNYDEIALVSSAKELTDAITAGKDVMLTSDIDCDVNGKAMTIASDADVLIDLNGNDIVGTTTVTGASQILFEVKGELTVVGDGTVALYDKSGASFNNAYENATIYVNGGVANLNEGTILTISDGAAMAYAADAVGGDSVINVNGATLYSSYIGIRSFPTVSNKTNTINYNSGVVYGAKNGYDIWTQEGSGSSVVNIAGGITYTSTDEWGGMYYIESTEVLVSTKAGLTEAIANGGTVVLADDVFVDSTLTIPKNKEVVLDLGGNELSGCFTQAGTSALIYNQGSLTIKNGTIVSLAENPDTDWNPEGFPTYASNTITNRGTLVIEEGTVIENQTNVGGASYAIDNQYSWEGVPSVLTVNGGTILAKDVAIRLCASTADYDNSVTIKGGTIMGKRAVWIHLTGSDSAVAPKANLTIKGGNLSATSGLVIYSYSYGNSFANTNVTITDGVFNGDVAFGGGYKGDRETVTVTGGVFNGELGRYLANDGWEDIDKLNA